MSQVYLLVWLRRQWPVLLLIPGLAFADPVEAYDSDPVSTSSPGRKLQRATQYNPQFLHRQGVQQLATGNWLAGIATLRRAATICSDCSQIRQSLAEAYCAVGDPQRAKQLRPGNESFSCQSNTAEALAPVPPAASTVVSPDALKTTELPAAEVSAGTAAPAVAAASNAPVAVRATTPQPVLAAMPANVQAAVQRAKQLLAAGKAESAYQLLLPFEVDALGDTSFDYAIGIAALDSGRPGDAAFALRRVVETDPTFFGARLELGRALYERGDYQHAAQMFNQLAAEQPPANAKQIIEQYQDAIRRKTSHQRSSISAYAEVAFGADSNASAGTNDNTFGQFLLDPRSQRQASARSEIAAGIAVEKPLSARWQLVGGLNGRAAKFPAADFVSGTTANGEVGVGYRRHRWRGALTAKLRHQEFNSEFNHLGQHAALSIERLFNDRLSMRLRYQAGEVEFADEISILDIDQQQLLVSGSYKLAGTQQPLISASLVAGRDDAKQTDSPFGRNSAGASVQYGFNLGVGRLFTTAAFVNSNYHGQFVGQRRQDAQQSLSFIYSIDHWPARHWRISPEILVLNNDSTLSVFDYERRWFITTLRRSFE